MLNDLLRSINPIQLVRTRLLLVWTATTLALVLPRFAANPLLVMCMLSPTETALVCGVTVTFQSHKHVIPRILVYNSLT
jgi:hypothetical protein